MKTRIKLKLAVLTGLAMLNLVAFQNCSNNMKPMDLNSEAFSGGGGVGSLSADAQAMSILESKCASCHSGAVAMGDINYITDLNSLKYFRVLVPHQAAASPIYTILSSDADHSSLLSTSEVQFIYKWINDMEGTAGTPPVVTPPTPTFAYIQANIFASRCNNCHRTGGTAAGAGVYTNYAGVVADVAAGNAAGSRIYDRITRTPGAGGFMPQGSTVPLSDADKNLIRDWINGGALNN